MTQYEALFPNEKPLVYANFGERVIAFLIDMTITAVIFALILGVFHLTQIKFDLNEHWAYGVGIFTFLIIHWLYYAISESTRHQGTPGKWIMRIAVTDITYKRLGFWHASLRNWSKLVSVLVLGSGFLGAAFTERRQTLHDIIANCLVVDRKKHIISDDFDRL